MNLAHYCLISPQQHAFITKHSTANNLLAATFDLTVVLNSNLAVICIDFDNTCCLVLHTKVLYKLSSFFIPNFLHILYTNFVDLSISYKHISASIRAGST